MNQASIRLLTHFASAHLPTSLQDVGHSCCALALTMAETLDSEDPIAGAEVTAGLRKLLEARECFLRAAVVLARRP